MDKFSKLKAAAMAATPGPWNAFIAGDTCAVHTPDDKRCGNIIGWPGFDCRDNAANNAAFIAAANPAAVLELLAENERVASDLVARNGEIEGLRKRAAELEAVKADASQVFKEIGNELGCNPDNESIMMAIDELKKREKRVVALAGSNAELWETMAARLEAAEAKLTTPVDINLPERRGDSYDWDGASPSEAFNTCRSICGLMFRQQLRAAGFKVEGEQ